MSDRAVDADVAVQNAPGAETSKAATTVLPSHIPVLDGIRGLAILLVMMFHLVVFPTGYWFSPFFLGIINTGWIGVDLFFVLSGFLITGILLDAKGQAHYFRNFYMRRALRIFPLYYGYLLCFFILVIKLQWVHFGAEKIAQAAEDLHWLWFYGTNILIAREGHFITASLNHFWSLAVEEHFYLCWPALVCLLDRRKLLIACPIIVALAIAVRCGLLAEHVSSFTITALTPCRMDGFAIGGFAAIALREFRGIAALVPASRAVFFGAFAILAAIVAWQDGLDASPAIQSVGYTILALLFCSVLLISIAAKPSTVVARVFRNSSMRFFGKYSYGLYVFHQPINIAFNRIFPPDHLSTLCHSQWLAMAAHALGVGGLSVLLAYSSWHLYEKQFLKLKRYFEYKAVKPS